jgi:outer membrane protein OmpA-like peptidoglycan-associated protein
MNRRHFLSAGLLALPMSGALAQAAAGSEGAFVPASRILEALRPLKDVVIDRPGQPPRPVVQPSIALQVQFTFGSSNLMPQGKRQLDELAMALNDAALRDVAFELAGHTDAVGSHAENMRLSMDRAMAVKTYLIQAHRLGGGRLFPIGFGFTRLADPSNPQGAINRRVEVRRLASPPPAPADAGGGRVVPLRRLESMKNLPHKMAGLALALSLSLGLLGGCATAPATGPSGTIGSHLGTVDQLLRGSDPARSVSLAVTPTTVVIGQQIAMELASSTPGYAYVVQVGTSGKMSLFFPNAIDGANGLKAGEPTLLPRAHWPAVRAGGPEGLSYMVLVVTQREQNLASLRAALDERQALAFEGPYGAAMVALREVAR